MWAPLEAEIEISRQKILAAISGSKSFSLIRGYGNIGDYLIYAGTRRLLSGLQYQEHSILKLDGVEGDLAVVTGGGAWCKTYDDMARNLPEVEKRFKRVIVLPSSFDLDSPTVAGALARTKALVFARERVSYEQIRTVCRADLAHDCAFFFNYAPYRTKGKGTLLAFRTDREAIAGQKLPQENIDISTECETLDEWLWTISRHEVVHTNRAHVIIAAIMLGTRVVYGVSNYHKVGAIVDYSFPSIPRGQIEPLDKEVARREVIEAASKSLGKLPSDFHERHRNLEVTVVVLSYNRLDATLIALRALRENVSIPFKLMIVDNDSQPEVREALRKVNEEQPEIEMHFLEENLGCSGGRAFAFQHVTTPYVLLLDNDVEILPGALEHLLSQFDSHRDAIGVTGTLVFPDGTIHLSGANHHIEDGVLYFGMIGGGVRFDKLEGRSGPCGWVPGGLTLFKMDFLRSHPYDLEMRSYYEDLDWCLEVEKQKIGRFYASHEAMGIHYHEEKRPGTWLPLNERLPKIMRFLDTLAYFYKKHGVLVEALFKFVPELGSEKNPLSVNSAKLLLELTLKAGPEWVAQAWMDGKLAPLFVVTSDYERYLHNEVETLRRVSEAFKTTRSWKLIKTYWRLRDSWNDLKARFFSQRNLY
jgi:GT2 family glycosyltransferase/exopolysaccharide biosynthesis predicted pyruvyltransferase EpsI